MNVGSWLICRRIALSAVAAAQQKNHQRLLRVQTVLRLVKDYGLRAIEHRVGNFGVAMRGQAVHEHGVRRGMGHQCLVDLVRLEDRRPLGHLMLEAHAGANVGVHRIRAAYRSDDVVGERERGPGFGSDFLSLGNDLRLRVIALGRRDRAMGAQQS